MSTAGDWQTIERLQRALAAERERADALRAALSQAAAGLDNLGADYPEDALCSEALNEILAIRDAIRQALGVTEVTGSADKTRNPGEGT